MSAESDCLELEERVRRRIAEVNGSVPGSIAEMMQFRLVDYDRERGDFTMTCKTMPWMRNAAGTLHGGLCATVLDQAMGFVSYCLKPGEGAAPTIQLQVQYHRHLHPGENVIVKVRVVNASRSLMSLTAEAFQESCPDRLCLSGSGLYFYKPKETE